jgi:hypothetical protein
LLLDELGEFESELFEITVYESRSWGEELQGEMVRILA